MNLNGMILVIGCFLVWTLIGAEVYSKLESPDIPPEKRLNLCEAFNFTPVWFIGIIIAMIKQRKEKKR